MIKLIVALSLWQLLKSLKFELNDAVLLILVIHSMIFVHILTQKLII